MTNDDKKLPNITFNNHEYSKDEAIYEFEQLKNIALNCFDKNGNPNILAAIRAAENKAKIANLYTNKISKTQLHTKMNEITLDGEQLKLNVGDEYLTIDYNKQDEF